MVAATLSTSSALVMRAPLLPEAVPSSRRAPSLGSRRWGAYARAQGLSTFSLSQAHWGGQRILLPSWHTGRGDARAKEMGEPGALCQKLRFSHEKHPLDFL